MAAAAAADLEEVEVLDNDGAFDEVGGIRSRPVSGASSSRGAFAV